MDWTEELHPRSELGRFAAKVAAAISAKGEDHERATISALKAAQDLRAYRERAKLSPILREPTTEPPIGREPYRPNLREDANDDGIPDRSRVGLGGRETVPPGAIPRLPNLTPEEREIETRFADAYERDPQAVVSAYRATVENNVFNTDDAKLLSPDYNPPKELGKSKDEVNAMRSRNNVMVHQTANAVAKATFVQRLDELPPGAGVLVTAGGCAAGKGYALGNVSEARELQDHVGAVWDAAGEQNSTENPWILEECQRRGLKPTFVFVDADPLQRWSSAKPHGAIERAAGIGRMVDARLFADSYAEGARNFAAFQAAHRHDPDVGFVVIDARSEPGTPRLTPDVPQQALEENSDDIYARISRIVDEYPDPPGIPPAIRRGASVGRRIWGAP
jgi:hypothetical protein